MTNYLASTNPFGPVLAPPGVSTFAGGQIGGIQIFLNVLLRTAILGAGVYALVSILVAGYMFMSASGDPKKVEFAWARIWQTILGLAFAAGSFVVAGIIGQLLYNDPTALLQLRVFGP